MSTPLERAQEIANRGLQDKLPPEKREKFNELVSRKIITLPGVKGDQSFDISGAARDLQIFMGRDPDFSQEGVRNSALRSGLSRMDTPEEREAYLEKTVGKDGFTKDRFGNLALTKLGAEKIGQKTDKPIIIDEPSFTKEDIADLRGVAPTVVGGVAGATAASGVGILPAAALSGLAAAGFKGIDEAADALLNENLQSAKEVATDLAIEGGGAAAGEGVFRGILAPLGRKILAPNKSVVMEGAGELVDEATKIGVTPKIGNLINRPILTRMSGLVDTIFGDINAAKNSKAIGVRIKSLRNAFGKHMDDALDLGSRIKADIGEARKSFGDAARARFALVDKFNNGKPIVSTVGIKRQAQELLDALPKKAETKVVPAGNIVDDSGKPFIAESTKTVEGKAVLTPNSRIKDLNDVLSLPENITVEQLQALRNTLFDRMEFGTVTPGISSREARLLVKSIEGTVDDTIKGFVLQPNNPLAPQALDALKEARDFYAKGIKQFDNATIKRIVKDPSIAGSLDPERVVDLMFKKGSVTPMKRVMNILPEQTKNDIRSEAMNKVLDSATKESGKPLVGELFDGTGLIKTLNSYGEPALNAMFGAEKTKELYTLGKVIQSASRPEGSSGGIVAASIAVRPLHNVTRLIKLRITAHILNSKNGIKWLTEGIKAPKTRAGTAALSRLALQVNAASEGFTLGKEIKGTDEEQ